MEPINKVQFWQVEEDCAGQRIDNFLFSRLKGVPKSRIYRLLRKGEIRINKKRCKAETRLCEGDQLRIPPIRFEQKQENPEIRNFDRVAQLEQQIIYESSDTILINKPAGMAVHGGSGLSYGLIEGLRAIRPQARYLELVHRLDKDTSGCLLVAKKRSALRFYQDQLRNKQMQKEYLAICDGRMDKPKQVVNAPLLKVLRKSGERVVHVDTQGKKSTTRFECLAVAADATLVRAWPLTGRTHQIRVHAAHIELPLVLDEKYNRKNSTQIQSRINSIRSEGSFFLHARALSFTNASDGQRVRHEAQLPQRFLSALNLLGLNTDGI